MEFYGFLSIVSFSIDVLSSCIRVANLLSFVNDNQNRINHIQVIDIEMLKNLRLFTKSIIPPT